ncbi:ABC-type sugar transport system ATPase subunit [Streptomyces sp. SAI-133]|uniref:ATP-binding cassette domain-containing protein n=1 Tax=unclassified Streptomyces TaxID=2593676 RepID=UPI0024767DF1|nr:response regulator [Streptomyces sp. SAI-133]MDH6583323.1 ABC-type sugar transport system ATPase subunit [Streptomyces sp. SAI-133]
MTTHADELAVDVRGLPKRYGDVTAVDGIDLGIRRGEAFGLLGPNGAGKSTTVEILQSNRARDTGEVLVLDADPAHGTRAWRSRVGIVRQDESAPAELTVAESVRHFARYYLGAMMALFLLSAILVGETRLMTFALVDGGTPADLAGATLPDALFRGRGFDPEAVHGGYGLSGLRARVTEGGGTTEVGSAPGEGTTITLRLPVTCPRSCRPEAPAAELRPDIVLMDLRMPGGGGVESIVRMSEAGLPCRVVVLTTYETDRDILRAVEAGAAGHLLKDLPRGRLAEAVRRAARGARGEGAGPVGRGAARRPTAHQAGAAPPVVP